MKRFIVALMALLPVLSYGDADDLFMNQRDHTNTNTLSKRIPATPSDAIVGYIFRPETPTNRVPYLLTLGPGLTLSGGVLDAAPASVTWANVAGKPAFAPVATTGAYADLSGKPVLFSGAYASLTGIPSTFAPAAHTQAWSTINATPTTLAGYGITDALPRPTGTTAQYIRGDGSLATLPALSINDTPGRTLVTSTAAAGYQVSSTRAAQVCYEGTFSTTSTIGGPSSASVFLETSDTNAGDWTVRAQQTYSNTITLAVVLNQVQSNNWSFCRYIPADKFVRLRSGNITGTASVSLNATQQETLY